MRNVASAGNAGIINGGSGDMVTGGLAPERWVHVLYTLDTGLTGSVYVNGAQVASGLGNPAFQTVSSVTRTVNQLGSTLAHMNYADNSVAGVYDEARLANVPRSAAWVKLEYSNQMPNGGLAFFDSAAPRAPLPPTLAYAPDTLKLTAGTFLAAVTPVAGGIIDSITVSPALSAGLTFNKTTGQISGTPAATATATTATYVFTAMNRGGSAKDTIVVMIEPSASVFGRADLRDAFSIRSTSAGVVFRLPEGASRGLLTVSDLHGRAVWSREMGAEGSATMSRGDLPMGVYTVKLTLLQGTGAGNSLRKSFTLVR